MRHLLEDSARRAIAYLEGLGAQKVAPSPEAIVKLAALNEPMGEQPSAPDSVLQLLDEVCSPASMATANRAPRCCPR